MTSVSEWFIRLYYNLMPQIIQNLNLELKDKLTDFLNIKFWLSLDVWYVLMV